MRALEAAGQIPLAAAAAAAAGLDDEVARLTADNEAAAKAAASAVRGGQPAPPPLLLTGGDANWPLLQVTRGVFESLAAKAAAASGGGGGATASAAAASVDADAADAAAGAWGDDLDLDAGGDWGGGEGEEGGVAAAAGGSDDDGEGGWDGIDDLDLPTDVCDGAAASATATGPAFVAPAPGPPPEARWLKSSTHAGEHAAAGAVESAARLLNGQLGIVNFAPLTPTFTTLRVATLATLPGLPGTPSLATPLGRDWAPDDEAGPPRAPRVAVTVASLEPTLRALYAAVTDGKFAEGLTAADTLLHAIPFAAASTRQEADEVKELLGIAREYNVGLRCELARKAAAAAGDTARAAALAAYFTHAALQPAHATLALRSAMVAHYKMGNLATAATFCRRLLDGGAPSKIGAQARQVLAACERAEADAVEVDYDPRNPFDLCSLTWTPIYR